MEILLLGAQRCKHCKTQKKHFLNTFGNKKWIYIDITKDKESLEIAQDISIEHIPAIIILNDNKRVFKRIGTLPPDQAFQVLYGQNSLPVSKYEEKSIINGTQKNIILSYSPDLKPGQKINLLKYSGNHLLDTEVKQCIMKETHDLPARERAVYTRCGGRNDFCWIVNF